MYLIIKKLDRVAILATKKNYQYKKTEEKKKKKKRKNIFSLGNLISRHPKCLSLRMICLSLLFFCFYMTLARGPTSMAEDRKLI